MVFPRSRVFGFSLFVGFYGLLAVVAFSSQIAPLFSDLDFDHLMASVLFFDRFYLDFIVLLIVGIFLVNSHISLRIIAYLCLFLVFGCYLIQFLSVYIGGEFVSILAIDNVNHLSLLFGTRNSLIAIAAVLIFLVTVYVLEVGFNSRLKTRTLIGYGGLLLIAALAIDNDELLASDSITELRDSFYKDRSIRIAHKSPVESLFRNMFRRKNLDAEPFSLADARRAREYGFVINIDQRFPLAKDRVFTSPLPFKHRPGGVVKPNVIILFTEGLSARTTDVYGENETDLTPNMVDFSRDAMVVSNYFNHTFATYRGLHGQLCSIYPFHGGLGGWHTDYQSVKKIDYSCLTNLFNEEGYETLFLDTHRADEGYVDEMMKELHFDRVINAEEIADHYIFEEPLRADALSDSQLIGGLIKLLRERESAVEQQAFLIATYNLETHAWQKIADDGKQYTESSSYILDAIHNYDDAFGRFWQYFKQSTYRDNTIVILTSDHAHYPDRDFVRLVSEDPDYRPYFVDQIPLIIYDPGKYLPKGFDASDATSIDFAPTVAQLMGFNSGNSFLGTSLFDSAATLKQASVAAAGDEYFLIDSGGVRRHDDPESDVDEMQYLKRLIHTIHQLELHNRIRPPHAEEEAVGPATEQQ